MTQAIRASGNAKFIAACFLIGVSLQVLLATVNKASMWALYYGEENPGFKNRKRYHAGHWLSENFWIDLLVDVTTLLLFGLATRYAFTALIL